MRKIKIKTWKSSIPIKDKDGNVSDSKLIDENLLMALNILINIQNPQTMPRGIDNFKIFNTLTNAFEKAEKTHILELEEREYSFLKGIIQESIPGSWGMNK